MDKLFNDMFEDLGLGSFSREKSSPGSLTGDLLRPRVDVGASDKQYSVSIEIPGVDQKDITLEILDNSLILRGEKKQEKEANEKNFYRMERSYGAFQRILALPDDANQDEVQAMGNIEQQGHLYSGLQQLTALSRQTYLLNSVEEYSTQ